MNDLDGFDFQSLYTADGKYVHTELCGECDTEVAYVSEEPFVAVRCPENKTGNCSNFLIHCDACFHNEIPSANGGDCGNCPWQREACPSTGEMVPVYKGKGDFEFTCPSCGERHTVKEMEGSWDE